MAGSITCATRFLTFATRLRLPLQLVFSHPFCLELARACPPAPRMSGFVALANYCLFLFLLAELCILPDER